MLSRLMNGFCYLFGIGKYSKEAQEIQIYYTKLARANTKERLKQVLQTDREALKSDWEAVGNDMWQVISGK